MDDIDSALAALADPTRRGVVDLLIEAPRRTSELAEAIGVSVPAVSRHLRVLRDQELIERVDVDGDGRGRAYRLNPGRLEPLAHWLGAEPWRERLTEASPDPDASEYLARVGGFLDAFAASDTSYFERHLAADATLVFPGSSRVWDRASTIDSVAGHAPYIAWRVSDSSIRTLAPSLTLVIVAAHVRTTDSDTSNAVVQSMVFDDSSTPWTLRSLHQSRSYTP